MGKHKGSKSDASECHIQRLWEPTLGLQINVHYAAVHKV